MTFNEYYDELYNLATADPIRDLAEKLVAKGVTEEQIGVWNRTPEMNLLPDPIKNAVCGAVRDVQHGFPRKKHNF